MMQPTYPAARAAAARIHAQFERHLATAPQARRRAALPDTTTIEAMIEAAFWASLRREEGFIPRISLRCARGSRLAVDIRAAAPLDGTALDEAWCRGGSLLVVPANTAHWRESLVQPILYALTPPFSALAELADGHVAGDADPRWADAIGHAVDGVAGLTAVDGATVITDRYEVLAFGAKIVRRDGSSQVSEVILTEPIEGAQAEIVEPSQLGGTRHLSAAQFVRDQHDAVALVASQDGRFTVFAWSPCENMVRAHRIEVLLL